METSAKSRHFSCLSYMLSAGGQIKKWQNHSETGTILPFLVLASFCLLEDFQSQSEISARPSQEARSAPIAGIKIGDAVMTKTLS